MELQMAIFDTFDKAAIKPPSGQLLKWIGSKHRFAAEIISHFPRSFGTYYEPFLGSGAVLSAVAPKHGVASDSFRPLVEIWEALISNPDTLKEWYEARWNCLMNKEKVAAYEKIKAQYNANPNGADLLFLSRACYGGVVRFRKRDGHMSTPCGIHNPISPASFNKRVDDWHRRLKNTRVLLSDYKDVMLQAKSGDLIYCDPPYSYSQTILYGAQSFSLKELFKEIAGCKARGVNVALSIDGTKQNGRLECALPIPPGLFCQEIAIDCGRSMLKRFQMNGKSLESECVSDRLLLTY